jgi:hypothetical protein
MLCQSTATLWTLTYLHDELDRTNEEAEELENQVLLLLLHLVETIFATALEDLLVCETDAGVSLEHVLGDDTPATGGDFLLFLELPNQLSAFYLASNCDGKCDVMAPAPESIGQRSLIDGDAPAVLWAKTVATTRCPIEAPDWVVQRSARGRLRCEWVQLAYLVVAIVALEVVNESINVLVLLLFLESRLSGRSGRDVVGGLLVKLSALNVGRQRGRAGSRVFGHWRGCCGR